MILQWDHSKRSTYKSPHTSSIWGLTWNRWSHSSICNKNDANNIFSGWYKIGFEIKNEIEGQCQSSPKFSGTLRVLRCIIGPNLEILSWIGGEWCHGQAQNMAIFYFEVKFDLEVQGQLTPKTIGILIKVFCSSGPNLVILAWTGDKLSSGQASDYRTHRRTHRQTQATTIPEGQNWPRVKRERDTGRYQLLMDSELCLKYHVQHTEVGIKWPNTQAYFLDILLPISLNPGFSWQTSIGLCNGWVPNRQYITWTHVGQDQWDKVWQYSLRYIVLETWKYIELSFQVC